MIRVLVVDDQALVRSGFTMMLGAHDAITVVGEAADGARAVEQARVLAPDVVLMDVQMPVLDGIAATEQIVAEGVSKVIILTTFDRDDYLFAALKAGASGFLLKNCEPERLVEAVSAVHDGQALLAPEVTLRVIEAMAVPGNGTAAGGPDPRLGLLTPPEVEVLSLLGRGRSNAEIATELVLSATTVKTHVSNVLSKLHLRDRVQAVVCAYETGLIVPGR